MLVGVCDVLVVDDQAGVRCLLYEAFREMGYCVETASSGLEAIEKVKELHPLVVVLDIKMPGMSGLETLDRLRQIATETPVVIMTAYGEMDVVIRAREKGIEYCIIKPFDIEEARAVVCRLVERVRSGRDEAFSVQ